LLSPLRIAFATSSGVAAGSTWPPVAFATAVAWPLLSSPLPNGVETGIAITIAFAACSAAIASASVWPPLGS
jgi:hypothetical protein